MDSSRLDKLLRLLSVGNKFTRDQAAISLAHIAQDHPNALPQLVAKLEPLFQVSDWNSRISAASALRAVLSSVKDPIHLLLTVDELTGDKPTVDTANIMGEPGLKKDKVDDTLPTSSASSLPVLWKTVAGFDLANCLTSNSIYLGSAGTEYDVSTSEAMTEEAARQRINRHLGINPAFRMETKEWFSDSDLTVPGGAPGYGAGSILGQSQSRDNPNCSAAQAVNFDSKIPKIEPSESSDNVAGDGRERCLITDSEQELPLIQVVINCCRSLHSPAWEVRHGAALALQEVSRAILMDITIQPIPVSVGSKPRSSTNQIGAATQLNVNTELPTSIEDVCFSRSKKDLASRQRRLSETSTNCTAPELAYRRILLCLTNHIGANLLEILALDRFSDFIGAHVVAPVKETAAQALVLLIISLNNPDLLPTNTNCDTPSNNCLTDNKGNFPAVEVNECLKRCLRDKILQFTLSGVGDRLGPENRAQVWSLRLSCLLVLKYALPQGSAVLPLKETYSLSRTCSAIESDDKMNGLGSTTSTSMLGICEPQVAHFLTACLDQRDNEDIVAVASETILLAYNAAVTTYRSCDQNVKQQQKHKQKQQSGNGLECNNSDAKYCVTEKTTPAGGLNNERQVWLSMRDRILTFCWRNLHQIALTEAVNATAAKEQKSSPPSFPAATSGSEGFSSAPDNFFRLIALFEQCSGDGSSKNLSLESETGTGNNDSCGENVAVEVTLSSPDRIRILLPFLESPLPSVRLSALQCLLLISQRFIHQLHLSTRNMAGSESDITPNLLKDPIINNIQLLMQVLFQRMLLETSTDCQWVIHKVWNCLLRVLATYPTPLVPLVCPNFGVWLSFLMLPYEDPRLAPDLLVTEHFQPPPIGNDQNGSTGSVNNGTHSVGNRNTGTNDKYNEKDNNINNNSVHIYETTLGCFKTEPRFIGSDDWVSASNPEARAALVARNKARATQLLAACCPLIASSTSVTPGSEDSPAAALCQLLLLHLSSASANQIAAVCALLVRWARSTTGPGCDSGNIVNEETVSNTVLSAGNATLQFFTATSDISRFLGHSIQAKLMSLITQPPALFDETALPLSELNRLARDCVDFMQMKHLSLPANLTHSPDPDAGAMQLIPLDDVQKLIDYEPPELNVPIRSNEGPGRPRGSKQPGTRLSTTTVGRNSPTVVKNISQSLGNKRTLLVAALDRVRSVTSLYQTPTLVWIASATVALEVLPPKFNPLVKPLMEAVKAQFLSSTLIVPEAARTLADLFQIIAKPPPPAPNPQAPTVSPVPKILKNLCLFACSDPNVTPPAAASVANESRNDSFVLTWIGQNNPPFGCCPLDPQLTNAASDIVGHSTSFHQAFVAEETDVTTLMSDKRETALARNARFALASIVKHCRRSSVTVAVPSLIELVATLPIDNHVGSNPTPDALNKAIHILQIIEIVFPHFPPQLQATIFGNHVTILTGGTYLGNGNPAVRLMTCRALLAMLISAYSTETLSSKTGNQGCDPHLHNSILPQFYNQFLTVFKDELTGNCGTESNDNLAMMTSFNLGCLEMIYLMSVRQEALLMGFVAVLILPVLRLMTDTTGGTSVAASAPLRQLASLTFANLIKMVPLEVRNSLNLKHPIAAEVTKPQEKPKFSISINLQMSDYTETSSHNMGHCPSDSKYISLSAPSNVSTNQLPPVVRSLRPDLINRYFHAASFIRELTSSGGNTGDLEANFTLPFSLSTEFTLRSYQVDGIRWLRFLHRYNLHGILADDMGLGKTLQTLCAVAWSHVEQETNTPSLIVCPTSVALHWRDEIHKWFQPAETLRSDANEYDTDPQKSEDDSTKMKKQDDPILKTSVILSPLHDTATLARLRSEHSVIIIPYEVLKRSAGAFLDKVGVFQTVSVASSGDGSPVTFQNLIAQVPFTWNYVILDEGHVIRNPKTAAHRVVTSLMASHRIILTGTPIQNSVTELWALFEFVMPGYLGSASVFNAAFAKPITAARKQMSDEKCSKNKDENDKAAKITAGQRALDILHKQVLPFILRRQKTDVLRDLPPKIIQDYYLDLSPLQRHLYEQFVESVAVKKLTDRVSSFKILSYLRQLVDHPVLVAPRVPDEPSQREAQAIINQHTTGPNPPLDSIVHSGKLLALAELLSECGIGRATANEAEPSSAALSTSVVSQHRALIFCQFKGMIDAIERALVNQSLGIGISYLRLDGSVSSAAARHEIVRRFNNDLSIDVLLLTTAVGGLGLNLTGADTVIFVDHAWNPAADLQAMDRAHRLGQTRTVSVYRLIARDTLEESIMGLQRFKQRVAATVVSDENASMLSVATEQLLDMLGTGSETVNDVSDAKKGRKRTINDSDDDNSDLAKVWDQAVEQYDDAFSGANPL